MLYCYPLKDHRPPGGRSLLWTQIYIKIWTIVPIKIWFPVSSCHEDCNKTNISKIGQHNGEIWVLKNQKWHGPGGQSFLVQTCVELYGECDEVQIVENPEKRENEGMY